LEATVTLPVRKLAELPGRLLVYFPDQELADGASEIESDGFFDLNDAPPWDTWIGLYPYPPRRRDGRKSAPEEYLVSWVPSELVPAAERGIRVNALDCIAWIEESDVPLKRDLRNRGFID
jgi:hypothetical protein